MKRTKTEYSVVVGNVGQVHRGTNRLICERAYKEYVFLSQRGIGRVGQEQVSMFANHELVKEFDYGIWQQNKIHDRLGELRDVLRETRRTIDSLECDLEELRRNHPYLVDNDTFEAMLQKGKDIKG